MAGFAGLGAKVTLGSALRVQKLRSGAHSLDNITILITIYINILIAYYPRIMGPGLAGAHERRSPPEFII